MDFKSANSLSKFNAPIFSFIHENPPSSLSLICCFINEDSPIQIRPLIGIESFPLVNSEGNNSKGDLLFNDAKAISKPN